MTAFTLKAATSRCQTGWSRHEQEVQRTHIVTHATEASLFFVLLQAPKDPSMPAENSITESLNLLCACILHGLVELDALTHGDFLVEET
jgi:hypothetical protein